MNPLSPSPAVRRRLAFVGLLVLACAPGYDPPGDSSLDEAVGLYIAGRYAEAIERLEPLSRELKSEEDLTEVYLYLGRAYLALERYDRAVDAFTVGASYGSASPFREYLQQLKDVVASSPENIAAAPRVTRGELARAIDRMFFRTPTPVGTGNVPPELPELETAESVRRGIVAPLADGEIHADAYVTRAAFYAVVCKLLGETAGHAGISGGRRLTVFPGGYRWVMGHAGEGSGKSGFLVSGAEVVAILGRVAELED